MEITWYLQMFSLKTVVMFFTLLSHHCAQGKLEIRRMESLIKVRPGDNMTLPCLFYGYQTPLDLSKVAVRWTVKTSDEDVKQVYWFDGGKRIQNRPGLYIPDSELMEGNGSLYIPNVQPSDDGEYTCSVIVTPEKAISEVTMEVSAKPTCKLSDSRLQMNPDNDTVICYVNGFYPEHVKIQWVKYRNGFYNNSELDRRTWIREPVQNRDGTYNMASLLTLRPKSTEEDGDVYSCVIHHRSLEDPLQLNVTISVQPEPEQRQRCCDLKKPSEQNNDEIREIPFKKDTSYGSKPFTAKSAEIILIFLLVVLLIIAGIYIHKKVSLQVSEITRYDEYKILVSQISGFRPRKMVINLYQIKGAEKKKVDSWSPKTLTALKSQQDDVEHAIMPLRTMNGSTGVYLKPLITSDKWFSFNCVCLIQPTSQIQIDDGTGLILEVSHKVLKWPICRFQQINVKGNLSAQDVCNGKR